MKKILTIILVTIFSLTFTRCTKNTNNITSNSAHDSIDGAEITNDNGYVPIIKVDDNKSINFDESNNITSSSSGITYVGSENVGFVRLANSWREVKIPNFKELPIAGEAKEYKAYEDPENKYLLILATYGKGTGNQDELSRWIEAEPALGSSSTYYPSGTLEYLSNTEYGAIGKNSIFKGNIPVGYEFFATVHRDDNEASEYGLDDNNNILRGAIFEYKGTRFGLMYMRYNAAWDINFEILCSHWKPRMATEDEIVSQIMNTLNDEEDVSYKKSENDKKHSANVLNGDFSEFAGTYTPCSYINSGESVLDILLNEDGIITGGMTTNYGYNRTWAGTKPTSVVKNDDGTIICEITETEEYHEFYIIYPIGISDRNNMFDKNKVRIEYIIADGGILGYTYYKVS